MADRTKQGCLQAGMQPYHDGSMYAHRLCNVAECNTKQSRLIELTPNLIDKTIVSAMTM